MYDVDTLNIHRLERILNEAKKEGKITDVLVNELGRLYNYLLTQKEDNNEKKQIIKSLEGKTIKEAIDDLEERIFYESMAERLDFDFVNCCEEIIKELKMITMIEVDTPLYIISNTDTNKILVNKLFYTKQEAINESLKFPNSKVVLIDGIIPRV